MMGGDAAGPVCCPPPALPNTLLPPSSDPIPFPNRGSVVSTSSSATAAVSKPTTAFQSLAGLLAPTSENDTNKSTISAGRDRDFMHHRVQVNST